MDRISRLGACTNSRLWEQFGMDILSQVRADLKGASIARQEEVARAAGVPWATLRKIIDGATENPRYATVERLRAYYTPAAPPMREQQPTITLHAPEVAALAIARGEKVM